MKKRFLAGALTFAVSISCCGGVFAQFAEFDQDQVRYDEKSYVRTEVYTDDFEAYTSVSDLQDAKWKMTDGCVSISDGRDGGKAVTLGYNSEEAAKNTEFHRDVNANCGDVPVLLSEDLRFSDNTSRRKIMQLMHWVSSEERYEINGLVAHENGYFCLDDNGEQKLMPYEKDTWYTIKAVVDGAADTVEYTINGKNVTGKLAIDKNFAQVTRFTPIKQGGTATAVGTVTVDNYTVYSLRKSLAYEENMIQREGKAYSVNALLADDFNSYTTSGLPEKWMGSPVDRLEAVSIDAEHKNSVKLSKDSDDVELYRVDQISGNTGNNGIYIFSAEYWFNDPNGQRWLMLLPKADKTLITQSGQFKIKDTTINLMPVTEKRWYTVSALVDLPAQRYEYYIDGKLVMEGGFTQNVANMERITLGRERGNGCWHAIDNFKITKLNEHPTNMQLDYNGVKYDGIPMDTDNFDAYTGEKTAPEGWTASANDTAYASAEQVDSLHGTSVKLTKVSADAEIYKNFSSGLFWDPEALYMVSADYMFKNTNSQRPLMIIQQNADAGNTDLGPVEKRENYVLKAQNNGWFCSEPGDTRYTQYEQNKWYRIQTVIDVKNQKYMIFVNGEVLVPATDFPTYFCNINKITLAKQRGVGDVMIDNYGLYKMKKSIDNEISDVTLKTLYQDGFGINERTTETKEGNVVEYVEKDDGYAMKIGGADNVYAYAGLPIQEKNYSKYIFTENIRFSDTTQSRYLFALKFANDTANKEVLTIKTNGNKIKDAATNVDLMEYKKDTWYKIQLMVDVENNKYSVYVDGAFIGEGTYSVPVENGKLSGVAYISSWGSAHNDVYLDDLAIQTAQEFEIIRNVRLYYDGEPLTAVSDLMDGDEVAAQVSFDTENCMVVIALYDADGRLKQATVNSSMIMPNEFDDCTMKAFVLDKASLAPQCTFDEVPY